MTPDEAVEIAIAHLGLDETSRPGKTVVFPSAGFRNWNDDGKGGPPGTYDIVAAEHLATQDDQPFETLRRIMSDQVPAATLKVRMW